MLRMNIVYDGRSVCFTRAVAGAVTSTGRAITEEEARDVPPVIGPEYPPRVPVRNALRAGWAPTPEELDALAREVTRGAHETLEAAARAAGIDPASVEVSVAFNRPAEGRVSA